MLEIKIHPQNAETAAKAVKTEPAPNRHGYASAIYATMNGHRYTLETLKGPRPLYVLTVEDPATKDMYIIVLEDYTPDTITIRDAEIYKAGSNYPRRREESPRYLAKYKVLAAMVHGLITNGETAEKAAEAPAEIAREESPAEDHEKPHKAVKACYNVVIYTTSQGVRRADIRTPSGRPFMDIPAAELDAIREETARKDPERVQFIIDDTTTANTTTPGDSTPRATKEAPTDYRRARLQGHATTEAATTSAEIRSRARNRVKAARTPQRTAGNNYTTHHGNDP